MTSGPDPTLMVAFAFGEFRPACRIYVRVVRAAGYRAGARTTRRTVVGMLAGAGMAAAVSFHSACRFFSHHAWDVEAIGLVLTRLIVDRLLPDGAPITVVVDDTLFRPGCPRCMPRTGPTTAPPRTATRWPAATGG